MLRNIDPSFHLFWATRPTYLCLVDSVQWFMTLTMCTYLPTNQSSCILPIRVYQQGAAELESKANHENQLIACPKMI